MYLNAAIVGLIAWAGFIGLWVGASVGNGKGAFFGALAGAGAAVAIGMVYQQSEITSWRYDTAQRMIASDCRMTPLARTVLADKRISEAEYWRLEDQAAAIELGDARSRINGDPLRQCPSTR